MFWIVQENKQAKQQKAFIYQLCFGIILLILTSCATNIIDLDTQAIPNQLAPTQSLEALLNYFPTNNFAARDFTARDLVKLYGEPLSIDYIPYLNHHNIGQIDGISTYTYDGFEFSIYHVTSYHVTFTNKALLMDLVISSPTYSLPLGIQVGSGIDEVLATLGIPYDRHNDISIYLLADNTETLLLTIKENKVIEMMWQFYWD